MAVDDPAFAAVRANAEPMILDEPTITLESFEADAFSGVDLTIALGKEPLELISDAARQLERRTGRPPVVVDAPHEVYLEDPSVLTRVVIAQAGHGLPPRAEDEPEALGPPAAAT